MAKAKKKMAPKKAAKKAATKAAPKKATGKVVMTAKAAAPAPAKIRNAIPPRNGGTKSYTVGEFLENIRGFCGLRKRTEAKQLSEDIANFIGDALRRGYKIPLFGLGKMYVRHTAPRMGRNPATGEMMHIPARKRVKFSVAKALKQSVL